MTETPETTTADAPELDFDAWLDGATITQASVEILQRPDLLARYADWERRYDRAEAEWADTVDERSASDPDPLAAIKAEGEALLEQMQASRATWYVRAMSDDDQKAIEAAFPLPEQPESFKEHAPKPVHAPTEVQGKAFLRGMEAWELRKQAFVAEHAKEFEDWRDEVKKVVDQRDAESIARCVVSVEVGGRQIADHITHEQAAVLGEKINPLQVKKIVNAIVEATTAEPEVPADFLSRTSASDPQ